MNMTFDGERFILSGMKLSQFAEPDRAGLKLHGACVKSGCKIPPQTFYTHEPWRAANLLHYADDSAKLAIGRYTESYLESFDPPIPTWEIPCPEGESYLPFQKAGIGWIVRNQTVLLADQMGTGKTIQAIGAYNALGCPKTLCIVPAALRINWFREASKWMVRGTVGIIKGSKVPDVDFVIGSYASIGRKSNSDVRNVLREMGFEYAICDEAHKLKNKDAQRTKLIASNGGILWNVPYIVLATGTPIMNRPDEVWSLMNLLSRGQIGDFYRFQSRYCQRGEDAEVWRGGRKVKYRTWHGAKNENELGFLLRSGADGCGCMIRRLKRDVMKDLPSKTRSLVELDVPADIHLLAEAEGSTFDEVERLRLELEAANGGSTLMEVADDYVSKVETLRNKIRAKMSELARIRRQLGETKAPFVLRYVNDMLESVDKIVVFTYHRSVSEYIHENVDCESVLYYGGLTDGKRQEAVDRFQNDPNVRVFVGSIAASGVGLTLTASHTVVFAELDWTPAMVVQAEDRCHRKGQTTPVTVYQVIVDGSIDARIARKLLSKQRISDHILEDNYEQTK